MNIFVIMFNDYPQEVCALGTTEAQADARAAEIKEAYLVKQYGLKWRELKGLSAPGPIYVAAREVALYTPGDLESPGHVRDALDHFEVNGDELDQYHAKILATDASRWDRFRKAAVSGINNRDFSFPERLSEILGDSGSISETRLDEAFDEACKKSQG